MSRAASAAPADRSADPKVIGALVLVQLFFGAHYVAVKQVLASMTPPAWALVRVALAAVVLVLWSRGRGGRLPRTLREWGPLAGFALCGVVINQICFVEGLSRTTPAHASLICTTIPLWTLIFAVAFRRESLVPRHLLGLLVAGAGVALLLRADRFHLSGDLLTGDLFIVVNSASYGLFLVVSKRYLERHDPLAAIGHVFLIGTAGVALWGLPDLLDTDVTALPPAFWVWGAFIVLIPTVGSYALNFWALARAASSLVALFIYLQPVVATTLDGLLRGAWPGPRYLVAAVLVFAGVALGASRRRGRTGPPATPSVATVATGAAAGRTLGS